MQKKIQYQFVSYFVQLLCLTSQASTKRNVVILGKNILNPRLLIDNLNTFHRNNSSKFANIAIKSICLLDQSSDNVYCEYYEANTFDCLTFRGKQIFKPSSRIDGIILNDTIPSNKILQLVKSSPSKIKLIATCVISSDSGSKQNNIINMKYIDDLQKKGIFYPLFINHHFFIGTTSLL